MRTPNIELLNMDCMHLLEATADKSFDLAIVDPPYGIGESSKNVVSRHHSQAKYKRSDWDNKRPDPEYFSELKRVSKNQIVFGANYFMDLMPWASSCWIYWDKDRFGDFADGELAYTSFKTAVRHFKYTWDGFRKQRPELRIHPTQKPVDLYRWLLDNYAKSGDKILDTHGGGMSIAIACHQLGYDLTLCEKDEDYYTDGVKRYQNAIKQTALF